MLWLGRIDYGLRATNMHSGQRHFDLTYGEWQPLSSSSSFILPEITTGKESFGSLQNSDFSVVSTPQGELFFADAASGELLTKQQGGYPLNLKSPVISAFSVKRGKRDRSGVSSMRDGSISINRLKVRHRISPIPVADLAPDSVNSVATVGEESDGAVNTEPGSVLIVQSSQGIHSDGMLYAIEIPTTPIVTSEQQPFLLPPSTDESRQWGLDKNDGMKKTETGSIALHPDRSLEMMESPLDISSGRIADVLGTATGKPLPSAISPPSLQTMKSSMAARRQQQQRKKKLLSPRVTVNSVPDDQSMELVKSLTDYTVQSDDDMMSELESGDYFESENDFYANEDDDYVAGHSNVRPPPRSQELLEDVLLIPDSAQSSPVLRQGRYKIHSDPYNGGMLTPSQQLLMENILLTKSLNQLQSEMDGRLSHPDGDGIYDDGDDFPPAFALFRLFFNRKAFLRNIIHATQVLQIFFLSLMLLVVFLFVILLFGVAVANLSVSYAAVLAKYPVLQQLLVLIGRPLLVILHFLQLDFLAVGAVRSLLATAEPPTTTTAAGQSSPSSRLSTKSRSDSATLTIDYDDFGRKVTKVGSLAIYETVLGFGSHGTVVFKGSLNGRPIAIKRMLSQFNKAADRFTFTMRYFHPHVPIFFFKIKCDVCIFSGRFRC
jgi:hypothetical protein